MYTVEPRFNEVAGDWPNLFVKWRVRYIEVLFHTFYCNFGRDIEIISFVISRTSLNRGSLNRGSTVYGSAPPPPPNGSLCCVLGQDTLLSQHLSPPRSKWVPANCQGNLMKCWEVTCDGLISHPGYSLQTGFPFPNYSLPALCADR